MAKKNQPKTSPNNNIDGVRERFPAILNTKPAQRPEGRTTHKYYCMFDYEVIIEELQKAGFAVDINCCKQNKVKDETKSLWAGFTITMVNTFISDMYGHPLYIRIYDRQNGSKAAVVEIGFDRGRKGLGWTMGLRRFVQSHICVPTSDQTFTPTEVFAGIIRRALLAEVKAEIKKFTDIDKIRLSMSDIEAMIKAINNEMGSKHPISFHEVIASKRFVHEEEGKFIRVLKAQALMETGNEHLLYNIRLAICNALLKKLGRNPSLGFQEDVWMALGQADDVAYKIYISRLQRIADETGLTMTADELVKKLEEYRKNVRKSKTALSKEMLYSIVATSSSAAFQQEAQNALLYYYIDILVHKA